MTEKVVNTTIEILGKFYAVRCTEEELASLQQAAVYLGKQMREVQDSGKAINLERIAIISALNITHQFLQLEQQKSGLMTKINQRIAQLQLKLDEVIPSVEPLEFVYSTE